MLPLRPPTNAVSQSQQYRHLGPENSLLAGTAGGLAAPQPQSVGYQQQSLPHTSPTPY